MSITITIIIIIIHFIVIIILIMAYCPLCQEVPPSEEPGCVKTFLLEDTVLPADGFLVIHREKDSNGTVSLHNSEGDQNLLLGQPELLDTADLFSVLFTIPVSLLCACLSATLLCYVMVCHGMLCIRL